MPQAVAIEVHPSHDMRAGVVCHRCQERQAAILAEPCANRHTLRALRHRESIGNVARQLACAAVRGGASVEFIERHLDAIDADLRALAECS